MVTKLFFLEMLPLEKKKNLVQQGIGRAKRWAWKGLRVEPTTNEVPGPSINEY